MVFNLSPPQVLLQRVLLLCVVLVGGLETVKVFGCLLQNLVIFCSTLLKLHDVSLQFGQLIVSLLVLFIGGSVLFLILCDLVSQLIDFLFFVLLGVLHGCCLPLEVLLVELTILLLCLSFQDLFFKLCQFRMLGADSGFSLKSLLH